MSSQKLPDLPTSLLSLSLESELEGMGTQQCLIELLLYLVWAGTMSHGSLPHGIKTIGVNRIGLSHGDKAVSGHGKVMRLQANHRLQRPQRQDNRLNLYLTLKPRVFESYEALLH